MLFERPLSNHPDSPAAGFKRRAFGKEKKQSVCWKQKVEQKELGLLNQLGSPVPEAQVGCWNLEKKKCGRESLDFAERPTGFAKTKC